MALPCKLHSEPVYTSCEVLASTWSAAPASTFATAPGRNFPGVLDDKSEWAPPNTALQASSSSPARCDTARQARSHSASGECDDTAPPPGVLDDKSEWAP